MVCGALFDVLSILNFFFHLCPDLSVNSFFSYSSRSPFVTGDTMFLQQQRLQQEEEPHSNDSLMEYYVDGGFTRVLHPQCETELYVPITIESIVHTFNPAMNEQTAYEFWIWGQQYSHHFHSSP